MRDTRCSKSACGTSPQIAGLPVPGPGSTGRPRAAAAPPRCRFPGRPGLTPPPGHDQRALPGHDSPAPGRAGRQPPWPPQARRSGESFLTGVSTVEMRHGARRRADPPILARMRSPAACPQRRGPGPAAFRRAAAGRAGPAVAGLASRAGTSRAGPGRVRWVRARRPSAAFVSRIGQGHPAARGPGLAVAERGRPAHPHLHWDRPRLLLRHAAADHRGAALPGRTARLDRDRARRPGNRSGLAQRPRARACTRPPPP